MKIALAMIVKGDDKEAEVLDRCLENVSPHVDGIFITATYKNDKKETAKVSEVAKKHGADEIAYFKWINDFAAARNFSFAQVPKEYDYILWCDADDIWRGLEKLKSTIEAHPQVDAFGFWYLYDFDEYKKPTVVHKKTMVVKNDGCVSWAGALHEDFKENRAISTHLVEGIERLHLSSEDRFKIAAKRNVEVSEADTVNNPNDPRVYWNYGNSLTSTGEFAKARKAFEEFVKRSESDEEKFLVHIRLASICSDMGDKEEAEMHHRIAIGMKPTYPDGYLQLGYFYLQNKNLDKAIEYLLYGITKKPAYQTIIAYNPRDYDYNPMMALSKAYIQKGRPDLALPLLKGCLKIYPDHEHLKPLVGDMEKETERMDSVLKQIKDLQDIKDPEIVRRRLNSVPKDLRSHPAISKLFHQFFVKTESSGKDLAIFCGFTSHEWNPDIYETKGFGGSEEAVYYLSKELVKLGYNVTVYNNCGTETIEKYGVTWKPWWEYNPKDKWDHLIIWRHPKLVDYDVNATHIYLDLHDVLPEGEFTEKRLAKIDKIFVKSKAHRVLFPKVPDEKFVIVPNGLDSSLFTVNCKRDPYLLINTSSPDRSLDVLPKLFKQIKEKVPQAKMKWAYGWGIFDASMDGKEEQNWKKETVAAMEDAGIEMLGKLNPADVAKLYQEASILAYPTEFYEIDCISVRKAQLAGCMPITTDFAALETTNEWGIKIHSPKTKDTWGKKFTHGLEDETAQNQWVKEVVDALKNDTSNLRNKGMEWAKGFTWDKIAKTWNENLCTQQKN